MLTHTVKWWKIRDTKAFDWELIVTSCEYHNTRERKQEPVCSKYISQSVYKTRNKLVIYNRMTSHDYLHEMISSQSTTHTITINKLCCVSCDVIHVQY